MRIALALVLLLATGCATTTLRMTSVAPPLAHGPRVAVSLPTYGATIVRGDDCRQRFGYGPRYAEHPPCVVGMSAPIFMDLVRPVAP